MNKHIFIIIVVLAISFFCKAQNLEQFTTTMQCIGTTGNSYLNIAQKKSMSETEAKTNKTAIDFALIMAKDWSGEQLQWYNMSGKDNKTPKALNGTATRINAISFDKDQFDQCKTNQDMQRMTGHITNNSFSHYATISDNLKQGVKYHCFIVQLNDGKRALIWVEESEKNEIQLVVKIQAS